MLGRRRDEAGVTLVELLVATVILGVVTTMLIVGWTNLNRASSSVVSTTQSRATPRDALSRISRELRGAQPTALPTPSSASPTPVAQPPFTMAAPLEVRFYSAFNDADSRSDGSALARLRQTRIWLDTATTPPPPWNPDGRTLYLQKDVDGNGSFDDAADRSILLARNVINTTVTDVVNGTTYTPVFKYAYRDAEGHVLWTDNSASSLALTSVVGVRVRLIVDTNSDRSPRYVDTSTTVRPRNAID